MLRSMLVMLGAAMLSGCFLTMSLPLGERGFLIWFTLVPLLIATRSKGFLFGFCGAILAIMTAAWLSASGFFYSQSYPEGSPNWVYASFGKFGMSFAIVIGIWGEKGTRNLPMWAFGALGVLSEAAQLVQLPSHLALSLYRHAGMVQIASVGGIWLVTFLVWWANFAVAEWLPKPRAKGWRILLPFPLLFAVFLLTENAWLPLPAEAERYAAIQTDSTDRRSLTKLQAEASQKGASIAVWPEFGGNELVTAGDTKTLKELSALPGMIPFVTSFRDDLPEKPHNIAAIFTGGEESPRYAKRRLFGGESRMHTAGDKAVSVEGRGLNICFDSCFPSIIRDTVRQGADVVLLPTIDPPSTNHFLAAVHASYTPFRSAENGVPFVRADGYAFSMMTDARGKIVAETGDGEKVLVADVPRATRSTIYRATGDWFIPFSAILVIAGIVRARRKSGVTEEGVEALTGEERSL